LRTHLPAKKAGEQAQLRRPDRLIKAFRSKGETVHRKRSPRAARKPSRRQSPSIRRPHPTEITAFWRRAHDIARSFTGDIIRCPTFLKTVKHISDTSYYDLPGRPLPRRGENATSRS
jgi:hypothetical protein